MPSVAKLYAIVRIDKKNLFRLFDFVSCILKEIRRHFPIIVQSDKKKNSDPKVEFFAPLFFAY